MGLGIGEVWEGGGGKEGEREVSEGAHKLWGNLKDAPQAVYLQTTFGELRRGGKRRSECRGRSYSSHSECLGCCPLTSGIKSNTTEIMDWFQSQFSHMSCG